MNEKKIRISIIIVIVFLMTTSVYFINQPITNLLIKEKTIELVCLSPRQSLISYRKDGSVIIKTIKKKFDTKDTSMNQKAIEIYMNFSNEIKREIFYIEIPAIEYAKQLESMIFNWKKNPFMIIKLIKILFNINSNISIGDRITLIFQTIRINPSQIIFINSEYEIKNYNKNLNSHITVEIINSKSDKNTIKKITEKLKKAKIDIIEQKNSTVYNETKIIINTIDNYEKAKEIIEIMGIKNREIYIEKGFMIGDVRIVISKDYKEE